MLVAGGPESSDALIANADAIHFVNEAFKHCKPVGAIAEGTALLGASSIGCVNLQGPDDEVISELGVVMTGATSSMNAFSKEFIKAIAQHRHWEREIVQKPGMRRSLIGSQRSESANEKHLA